MRPIGKCLNDKLASICSESIRLEEISYVVANYLPPALQTHCRVGSFRSGTLILVTSDPVWATELRYLIPELRTSLRTKGKLYQLLAIQIKIV